MKIHIKENWFDGGLVAFWIDGKAVGWHCPHDNMNGFECQDCGGYYD